MAVEAVPASLPPVDAVEVVDLAGTALAGRVGRVDGYARAAADVPGTRLLGRDADRVAAFWRALPPGEPKRCHTPPFVLRFYSAGALLCQASVCWACNNLFGEAGGQPLRFEFDASQPPARELLAACERAAGRTTAE